MIASLGVRSCSKREQYNLTQWSLEHVQVEESIRLLVEREAGLGLRSEMVSQQSIVVTLIP